MRLLRRLALRLTPWALLAACAVLLALATARTDAFETLARVVGPVVLLIDTFALLFASARARPNSRLTTAIEVIVTAVAVVSVGFVGTLLARNAQFTIGWSNEQLALVADTSRALLGLTAVAAAIMAVRRRAWPEYGLGVVACLAAAALVLGLLTGASGRLKSAPLAVPEPRLAVQIHDATILGSRPAPESTVSMVIVVPRYDKDGTPIGNETYQFPGRIVEVPEVGEPGEALIEFTRGTDDAKIKDVLARLNAVGRTVFVAAASP
jgi:hypothetical protein